MMRWSAFLIISIFVFWSLPSAAYVPPSHYSLKRVAERKGELKSAIIEFRVFRAVSEKNQKPTMLWKGKLLYPPPKTSLVSYNDRIPVVPLFVEPSPEQLIDFFIKSGFAVMQEKDSTLWSPEEIQRSEEAPSPFYKLNSAASVVRYRGRTALEYKNEQNGNKLLVEKDSYFPLAVVSKCPPPILDLAYGTSDKDLCSVDFEYRSGRLPFSTPETSFLSINDRKIAAIRIDKIISNPTPAQIAQVEKEMGKTNLEESDDIVAALYKFILY